MYLKVCDVILVINAISKQIAYHSCNLKGIHCIIRMSQYLRYSQADFFSIEVFNKYPDGSSFNFECGSPPSNWYFTPDGGTQTSDLPSNIAKSGSTLTFLSVTSSQEGLYTCTAGGMTETQFNLTVLGKL